MGRCLCRSALPWLLVALGVHLGGKDGIGPTANKSRTFHHSMRSTGFDGVREPAGHIGATSFFTPMR